MDLENENKHDETSAGQNAGGREGYQPSEQSGNYQNYRPGRSPRPRIGQPRPYANPVRPNYNRNTHDEDGFRPEGFGAGLQNNASQRPAYRPRYNNNNNGEGGYGQRPYRPRYNSGEGGEGGYNAQQRGGYGQPRPYRPRYNNGEGGEGGYGAQQRGGYGQQRPYRPRYNNGEGGEGGYGAQQRGGYGQPRPYNPNRGGYGQQRPYNPNRGGYGQQRPYRQHTADYDPNAKYSMKKRIEYKEEHYDPMEPIRLNKFLANAGVCSRREADEFIQAGVVTVNGNVVTELGTKILRTDEIKFHDQPVSLEKKVYVLLNKPKDHVTTSDDPQQRKTVMDLVKNACSERIYPVGRLDRNTTGVLLLTNDGDLASKLTHPKFLKKKVYHVFLDKNVTAHDIQQIRDGIMLEDGEIKADAVEYADPVDKKQVGIEIHSGKNRIVRRIFEHLGYRVTKLDRVLFAGLTKKNLRRGDWRYLTEEEVERLRMGSYE